MTRISTRVLAPIAASLFLGFGVAACSEDDDPQEVADTVVAVLSTDTPEGSEPTIGATEPADLTAEPTSATDELLGATTEGGCIHGAGESDLYIIFRGVAPGARVEGRITELPEDGLVAGQTATFQGNADGYGLFYAVVKIKRFGTYKWTTNGGEVSGEFEVTEVCEQLAADVDPGPPR